MRNKILVIPSWYPSKEIENKGTYFREQSALVADDFDVKIMTLHKIWISKRRYYLNQLTGKKSFEITDLEITPPDGFSLGYEYVSNFSQEKNYQLLKKQLMFFSSSMEEIVNWKPDLIHAHCTFEAGIIAQTMAETLNIPYIITEHFNPFLLSRWTSISQKLMIQSLEKANLVLGVSTHQCQNILMHDIDCKPIAIGNLVDETLFSTKKNIEKTTVNLLLVTLYPNFIKDVDTFFEAISLLINEGNTDIRATIIGGYVPGEYEVDYYNKQIQKFDLEKYCVNVKHVKREDMESFYHEADILISTSLAESFGVGICESLLCGTPVILTQNGGEQDYFEDSFGAYIPFRDPVALASKIKEVKSKKYDALKMRGKIIDSYGREAFKSKISFFYRNLIEQDQ